jgi:probable HAF family extracellular repeat protein
VAEVRCRRFRALLVLAAGTLFTGLVAMAVVSVPRRAEPQAAYRIVELATLDQGISQIVRRLNSSDEVVGGTLTGGRRRGFILRQGGSDFIEPPAGSDFVAALALNDAGGVVGSMNTATTVRGFRLQRGAGGGTQLLDPLPDHNASEAFGLNHRGEAVGYSSGPSGTEAVRWETSGVVHPLGTLAGGTDSRAFDVNDAGLIVGTSGSTGGKRAVLWGAGPGPEDLGTLPGGAESEATAINTGGDVVGHSRDASRLRAFLWTRQAGMRALGTPVAGQPSRALGINARGDVVGAAGARAVLWPGSGAPQDLNILTQSDTNTLLTEALDINARGVILALGRTDDGHAPHDHADEAPMRVFLLIPTR